MQNFTTIFHLVQQKRQLSFFKNLVLNKALTNEKCHSVYYFVVFVFNVPPTAKVRRLKVSSDRLVKPGIKPASPGLQGKQFIQYTTAAPLFTMRLDYMHDIYALNGTA